MIPTINQNQPTTTTKISSGIGTTIGVVSALALIANRRKVKFKDTFKKFEFNEKDVITLASASVIGGICGGIITDSANKKAKLKEGITQLVGNYIVPSLFVGGGLRLNKALNKKYKFPPITKSIQFASGIVSLVLGVIVGNKLSQKINEKIFGKEQARKLNWKDWAVQFDNVCLVTSMASSGTTLAQNASKIIPFAMFIPGYLAGYKKETSKEPH